LHCQYEWRSTSPGAGARALRRKAFRQALLQGVNLPNWTVARELGKIAI
jgi:hypothetical protein